MDSYRFVLLGPPTVSYNGGPALTMPPQQMAVLAALALRAGTPVGAEEIIDGLYDDEPPASATNVITNYVLRLRKALAPSLIVRTPAGYLLDADPADVDATAFLRAANTPAVDDPQAAAARLSAALDLWSGRIALAGLPGPWCARQRESLTVLREGVRQRWFDQRLALGQHAEALSDIAGACADHPYAEHLHATHMRALLRSGRQAEALQVYRQVRHTLAEELGIDPGQELTHVHDAILRGDDPGPPFAVPRPAAPAPAAPPAPTPAPLSPPAPPKIVPHQLPAPPADATGRHEHVARLAGTLRTTDHAVGLITGMGGEGKSTLATLVAHAVAEDFPDGRLWASLHGASDAPAKASDILADFLLALGVAPERLPEGTRERAALYRSVTADKRILVVLDDAADATQLTPLLPPAPRSAALITSRTRVTTAVSTAVVLDGMEQSEAQGFITAIIGEQRAQAEPADVAALAAACGHLPLALRIMATRLAQRPRWSVRSMVDRLSSEDRLLGELRTGDLSVDRAFALSFDQLTPDQATAFVTLAVPKVHDWSLAAAATVLDLPEDRAETVLEELVDTALLTSPEPGHYAFHDLVVAYARDKAVHRLADEERIAALTRATDFCHASVRTALRLAASGVIPYLGPDGDVPTVSPGAPDIVDNATALAWIRAQLPALVTLSVQVAAEGDRHAAAHTVALLGLLSCWKDAVPMGPVLEAAELLAVATAPGGRAHSDDLVHGAACCALGALRLGGPQPATSLSAFQEAIRYADNSPADDPRTHYLLSNAHEGAAVILHQLGDYRAARPHARLSTEAASLTGHEALVRQQYATALQVETRAPDREMDLGTIAARSLESAAWFERAGKRDMQISHLIIAGDAYHRGERSVEAAEVYERAAAIARAFERSTIETICHYRAAETYTAAASGPRDALLRRALAHAEAAVEGAVLCDEELITARAHQAMGRALVRAGREAAARTHLRSALALYTSLDMTQDADRVSGILASVDTP
ncbi:BTAD domain-containing putative transcriptional regulator [Streptomyces sp. NPDC047071]|uniref:AfsR/SARP family transcriptional regulator n=1 Tax=Streptomyces sp. NPDC047071 TaxID=3154808 RepID=UPI0034550CA9